MKKLVKKLKKFSIDYWPILALILISAVVYHKWLSFDIFYNADYQFEFSENMKDYINFSAWIGNVGFGDVNVFLWMTSFKFIPALFGFLNFNLNIADRLFIFWPFAFLTPISAYFLVKEIVKNKMAAFLGACVYAFNTYYLAINTQGHFSLSLAGTFAPLIVLFFWRYFEKGNIKNLIISALIFAIVGGYDFRISYFLFFILLAMPFWFLIFQNGAGSKKEFLKKHFGPMALFFGIFILLNLFWILPTMMAGSLASNEVVGRGLFPDNYDLDIKKTLTLFHPFWNGAEPEWFKEQKIPFYFWLIPILAFLGAFFNRKNKKILFWILIAVLGVFFSKQDASPFQGVYPYLHQNFPGFNAYREASKFYFITILSYAILIGAFSQYVFLKLKNKFLLKWLIFGFIFILFFSNAFPILNGKMKSIFVSRKTDSEQMLIRKYILDQPESFRTLWFPSEPAFVSYTSYRPKITYIKILKTYWDAFSDFSDIQKGNLDTDEKSFLFLSSPLAQNLISQSSVKYVFFEKNSFSEIKPLVSNPQWKKIDIGIKERIIFENLSVRPRIYVTQSQESIHRDFPYQKVDMEMKNSSHWNIEMEKMDFPFWLNFSEKYHPDWAVVCQETSWHEILFGSKIFSKDNHFKTDAEMNSFLIDPEEIKTKCVPSSDGKIRLSIFYVPQAYLYFGGLISILTVLFSFVYLLLGKRKGIIKSN